MPHHDRSVYGSKRQKGQMFLDERSKTNINQVPLSHSLQSHDRVMLGKIDRHGGWYRGELECLLHPRELTLTEFSTRQNNVNVTCLDFGIGSDKRADDKATGWGSLDRLRPPKDTVKPS
jgi:hypothetical protein